MGRTWKSFYFQENESEHSKKQSIDRHNLLLFPTDGYGLEPVSVMEMITWFIDFGKPANRAMNCSKIYSRIQLGKIYLDFI